MKNHNNSLIVFLLLIFIITSPFFLSCESPTKTSNNGNQDDNNFPLAPFIYPVELKLSKYPAFGDTFEMEARFRFIREDDPFPDAKHFRKFLEDSIFNKYKLDSVFVKGGFNFYKYLNHDSRSSALEYISGDSSYGKWMRINDSGTFKARFKAIKSDTVMAEALLWGYTWGDSGVFGGGFKHECFIIRETEGIGLGDCWTHECFRPPVYIQLTGLSNLGLGKSNNLYCEIISKAENFDFNIEIFIDKGLQLTNSSKKWSGNIKVNTTIKKEFSVTPLKNGIYKIRAEGKAILNIDTIKLRDVIYLEVNDVGSRFLTSTEYELLRIKEIERNQPKHIYAVEPPLLQPVMHSEQPKMILGLPQDDNIKTNLSCDGTINVSGFVYYNDNGIQRPLINASVYLYDDDITFCGSDDLLASTITDWNGYYSFTNIENCDCSGTIDMYLKVIMWNTQFRVINTSSDEPYTHITPTENDIPAGTYIRDMEIPYIWASKIFSNINLAWNAAAQSQWPGDIWVKYPYNGWPGTDCNVNPPVIYLGHYQHDWPDFPDVIQHEYAHGLMKKAYGTMPDNSGGRHWIQLCHSAGLAWSEGWANFYPQVINNDGTLDGPFGSINIERIPNYFCEGQTNEARVAGALLDLWDINNDSLDQNSNSTIPLSTLWAQAMWGQRKNSFSDYWSNLTQYLSCDQKLSGIQSVKNNTITVTAICPPIIAGFVQRPTPIYQGGSGVVTCNLSQGNGDLTYSWTKRYFPPGVSVSFEGNNAYINYNYKMMKNISNLSEGWFPESITDDGKTSITAPLPELTCTVTNSVGSDTRRTTVYLAKPYGCPFVYTWNGEVWMEDNNILPQSEYPENYGVDVTDYYQLFTKPNLESTQNGDRYLLGLGEFEQERTFLDKIQLLAIDHSPEAWITVDDSGQVIQFLKPLYLIDAQLDSESVVKMISELDGINVEISEGSNMSVWFTQDGGDTEQALLLIGQIRDPAIKYKPAGIISINDNQNNLIFTDFRLRRNPSYTWVIVPAVDTSTIQLDIQWAQDAALDYTELSRKLELPFTVTEASLLQAEHSIYGDVTSKLIYIDEDYTQLEPNDWITLEFSAPPIVEGMERSFILVSRGRYERIEHSKNYGMNKQLSKTSLSNSVVEYKLEQNYPNPFNPVTKIKYSIPPPLNPHFTQREETGGTSACSVGSLVTLKIYDLLGREIATLVNEPKQAGEYEIEFNANKYGLCSGIYFYQFTAGSFSSTKKFVYLR